MRFLQELIALTNPIKSCPKDHVAVAPDGTREFFVHLSNLVTAQKQEVVKNQFGRSVCESFQQTRVSAAVQGAIVHSSQFVQAALISIHQHAIRLSDRSERTIQE